MPIVADDYGLGLRHNESMRELLEIGAIDAVSVMVCGPDIESECKKLQASIRPNQQIGLHLNLTYDFEKKGQKVSVKSLLVQQIFRRIDRLEIASQIGFQWQKFVALFGRAPDFIDGHEHVHALPTVTKALCQFLAIHNYKGWIRYVGTPSPIKRLTTPPMISTAATSCVLSVLGTIQLRIMRSYKLSFNTDFGGIAPLNDKDALKKYYRNILEAPDSTKVIMAHPGSDMDAYQTDGHAPSCRSLETQLLKETRSSADNSA